MNEYNLEYMAGEENKEADMLSRLLMEVNVIDPNQELYHVDCCENLPVTAAEVAQETKADPILRRAYHTSIHCLDGTGKVTWIQGYSPTHDGQMNLVLKRTVYCGEHV